ncbi:MAG: putative bifunctional diguanylate cyclase/phosphodiesterase [Vitreoscilla sp.]
MSAPQRRWRGSLAARIALVFLVLLLAVQLASFAALRLSWTSHRRNELPKRLETGTTLLNTLLERRVKAAVDIAEVTAADAGFRTTLFESDDEMTIVSALDNLRKRLNATTVAYLDLDGVVLHRASVEQAGDLAPALASLRSRLPGASSVSEITLVGGKPFQVVLVPEKAPRVVGWILVAFPLDGALKGDMRRLSEFDVTLMSRAGARAPWVVDMTSLPAAAASDLADQRWGADDAAQSMVAVSAQGDELGVHAVPLGGDAHIDSSIVVLLSESIGDAVRLPDDLRLALIGITLLAIVVFGAGSAVTARRVTTPLRGLARAAERLGEGDYATPMRGLAREDEIGALSQAFERMRMSIGENQAQVLRLAYWDSLTGLPNRARFRELVGDAIRDAADRRLADGIDSPVAVLLLDLDRFKHVNDVLGYAVGDKVLVAVAERLARALARDGDVVARLSGDRFGVLLQRTDVQQAHAVALRIEQALENPLALGEHKVDMGAGVGIACWPLHADSDDALLVRAEMAMYAAKQRSDGPVTYDPAIDATSAQTLSLVSELRQAVDRNELRLYLQPKLALEDRGVAGAEALVRWQHPTRGLVPPVQFIPFAEQTGFIRHLTMWVFEEAARHWKTLAEEGLEICLSVNLSTRDLLDLDLPHKFGALLARHDVPAASFCLEITESAIMDDPQRALATLDALSAMGFKLSIDDFGTGYSSLAYLKRLPVDELKIDQSFVRNMQADRDDEMIVRSTIDLAHNLGITVVAEGVESAAAWNLLRELKCDQAQGYHMGRPMPVTEFAAWCEGWGMRRLAVEADSAPLLH